MLQAAVGVAQDRAIRPKTLGAVSRRQDPSGLTARLAEARVAIYRSLSTFSHFGASWISRVDRARQLALQMAGAG
jgi:lysozyme family protein